MYHPSAVTIAVHHQAFTMKTLVQTLNGMVLLVGMWKMKSFSSGIIYCVHCRFKLIFEYTKMMGQKASLWAGFTMSSQFGFVQYCPAGLMFL
jgi:hypothetical protein